MSFQSTDFRPLAFVGWGGKSAGHWRGQQSADEQKKKNMGLWGPSPQTRGYVGRGQIGTLQYRAVGLQTNRFITGITRNSTGVALGSCVTHLFATGPDTIVTFQTSDGSGNFSFPNPGSGPFYIVAYKPGSPDVAGTTVNTLTAV